MQLPTIREYGSDEYLYMEWVGGKPWDKTCVDIMERHGFATRENPRPGDIRRWLVPKDQRELAHHCLFTLQGYKRRLEGTVDCFSCRGAYDAIHCFVCKWDRGPPPEMFVKLAYERGITVDRAQIEDFINRVPSMAPAFPNTGFALTPNSAGRIVPCKRAWWRDESILNAGERDLLSQYEGDHQMEGVIWGSARTRVEREHVDAIRCVREAKWAPDELLTPEEERWLRGDRELPGVSYGGRPPREAVWKGDRPYGTPPAEMFASLLEAERAEYAPSGLHQHVAEMATDSMLAQIRSLKLELHTANARIAHLEGHIEVLKLEASPSAAESAKPKSTITINCQSEEDPL
jgi:hypothetical protein